MPDAALDDAAREFLAADIASFTTPGHGRNPLVADAFLALDLPLTSAIDDLRESKGMLPAAEARAARAWGADWCRFIVNGSSQGNQAMALGAARHGAKVIVSRTIHKSLFAAFVLGGSSPSSCGRARPGDGPAGRDAAGPDHGGAGRASGCRRRVPDRAVVRRRALRRRHDRRCLPCRWRAAARGRRLGRAPRLPPRAAAARAGVRRGRAGAVHAQDAAGVHAVRAAAGAGRLAGGAAPGRGVRPPQHDQPVGRHLRVDRPRRALLEHHGVELLDRTLAQAARVRAALAGIEGIRMVRPDAPAVHAIDPTKIVVSLDGTGADGFAVEADAYAAGVRFEMADRSLIVPLLHVGVADAWIDRLLEFLPASIERRRGTPRPPRASIAFTADVEPGMSPRDAFFAEHECVPVRDAIGRICAETVTPYPPGIPALAPGEVVTAAVIEALRETASWITDRLLQRRVARYAAGCRPVKTRDVRQA